MLYNYRAKTKDGDEIEGVIGAVNQDAAAQLLRERDLIIISIEEAEQGSFLQKINVFFNRVKSKDLVILSRQLAVMVSAGLPLVQALKTLKSQINKTSLEEILSVLANDVEAGTKFSTSLAKYPNVFNHFFVSMIKTGETTGKLDKMLNYLADQQEKDYTLKKKIQGMMIYPLFVICGLVVVGFVMMTFVVPKLVSVLLEADVTLPLTTRMLIATSNFFVHFWWLMILIVIGLIVGFLYYKKTDEGKLMIDTLKLKTPILGPLWQKIYLVRFSQGLATLLAGGVPLTLALKVVAQVVGNELYKELILETKERVEGGYSVTDLFLENKLVPDMIPRMMSVGEKTGKLGETLEKVADFYTREVDNTVSSLVSLIEPVIIVILGLAVGVMVSAIILPMYNMSMAF